MSELKSLQEIWGTVLVLTAILFFFFALWAGGCCVTEEEEEEEVRGAPRREPFRVTTGAPIGWTHAEHLRLAKSRIPPTLLEPLRPIRRA